MERAILLLTAGSGAQKNLDPEHLPREPRERAQRRRWCEAGPVTLALTAYSARGCGCPLLTALN